MTDTPAPASSNGSDAPSHAGNAGSGQSILEEIGRRTGGRIPRTSLHESNDDDTTPVHDPRVSSYQDQLRSADRAKYNVLGEIASGGMGVVLRGHDTELGRDVAMKVVHAKLADHPEVLERFVEEAQIGGQLQHPGIVPVYELGLMADERPYFTMKLVKGHTLAKLLSHRDGVEEDRVRFLSIFESVCQTVAYAHSKGVIHRDLKPANVMVGSFGEVQVVDWGLSKVLKRGGVADELASRDSAMSFIETVRSGPQTGSNSMVGNVLGTPDYMPPEQARGEIDSLDERADVFALGAILCEILTGSPPYLARDGETVVELAALGDLEETRARIEAANAAEPLKRLCLKCLMPSRKARPASAERVATSIHEHLAGLETAAHEAQIAAVEQRVASERSRRKFQLALSAAAILVLAAGGWAWTETQKQRRMAELERGFADARELTLERTRDGAYDQAVDAAQTGLRLLVAGNANDDLVGRAEALVSDTEFERDRAAAAAAEAAREDAFLDFLADANMRSVDVRLLESRDEMDAEYRAAFAAYGLDVGSSTLSERIEALRDTERALDVARGADGWVNVLRQTHTGRDDDIDLLTSIALDLDPDPLRADVRLALADRDGDRLVELAEGADLDGMEPQSFILLTGALLERGAYETARWVATQGADRHPTDFLLQFWAGALLMEKDPYRREFDPQSAGIAQAYMRASIALRPDLPTPVMLLGDYYRSIGNYVLSEKFSGQAERMAPQNSWDYGTAALDEFVLGHYELAQEYAEMRYERTGLLALHDAMLRRSRVINGELELDEYVRWTQEEQPYGPTGLAGAALALTSRRTCDPPQPARALEVLAPALEKDLDHYLTWLAAGQAHVLLGDGESALRATVRMEDQMMVVDRHQFAELLVLRAAAHRLTGADDAADRTYASAVLVRDDLFAGHEDEWADGILADLFRWVGPIAAGD